MKKTRYTTSNITASTHGMKQSHWTVELEERPQAGDFVVVEGLAYRFLHELSGVNGTQLILSGQPADLDFWFVEGKTLITFEKTVRGNQPSLRSFALKLESIPATGSLINVEGIFYKVIRRIIGTDGIIIVADDHPVDLLGQHVVEEGYFFKF